MMMIFKNFPNLILLFFIFLNKNVYPITYNRPLPESFHISEISKIYDVFSYSIAIKVHSPLFEMDHNNHPQMKLIENFKVFDNGKLYKFKLKKINFHDGSAFNAETVINNIEYFLANKIEGYEKLFSIDGVEEFCKNEARKINGLFKDENDELIFYISLKYNNNSLINQLAERRLSILKNDRNPYIGLGDFKLEFQNKNKIKLLSVNKKIKNNEISEVIYHLNVKKYDAIIGFKNKIYDDLFFYDLNKDEIKELDKFSNKINIITPRIYNLSLNYKKIGDINDRISLFSGIDWDLLRDKCYPGNKRAYSLMPKGFLGYKNIPSERSKEYFNFVYKKNKKLKKFTKKKYIINITQHLGSEECVKEILMSSELFDIIEIVPHKLILDNWKNNKIDGMFVWFEGGTNISIWGLFSQSSSMFFGDKKINGFDNLYKKYDASNSVFDKEKYAQEIDDHIINMATVFPIFHPKVSLIYSKKFKSIDFVLYYPYSIPFSKFKLIEDIQ